MGKIVNGFFVWEIPAEVNHHKEEMNVNTKFLHERYIDALLNGGDILAVKTALDDSFDLWRRQLDRQYETAKLMQSALEAPEDDPARIAVIQFLTALKGGDSNE